MSRGRGGNILRPAAAIARELAGGGTTLLGVVALAMTLVGQEAPASRIRLVAVGDAVGLDFVHQYTRGTGDSIVESGGSGAGWIDFDVDGDVDLVFANGLPEWEGDPSAGRGHAVFRNRGGRFQRAPAQVRIDDRTWGNGVAIADVDNDGFSDLLITAIGADRLYRNMGDGTFSAVRVGIEDGGWGTSAAFLDGDRDGFVDLYVARYVVADPDAAATAASAGDRGATQRQPGSSGGDGQRFAYPETCLYPGTDVEVFCGPSNFEGERDRLYRNTGDRAFEPWAGDAVDPAAAPGLAVVATDCDGDLAAEIYVANDLAANHLYRRRDDGRLEEVGLRGGVAYSGDGRAQAGMSAAAGDIDADGRLDIFVTNYEDDHNTLYHAFGNCSFEDATFRYGLGADGVPFMGWGALFLDVDGDADEDLFIANGHLFPQLETGGIAAFGQRNLLYANRLREDGRAHFVEVGEASGSGMQIVASSRSVARADYDDDGDADLLVTNMNAPPNLLRNDTAVDAAALRLTLIGRASNRTAYGTRVRALSRSGAVEQHFELRGSDGFQGSNDPRLLLHLPGGLADVTITWPSGERTVLRDERPGRIVVDELLGVIARAAW